MQLWTVRAAIVYVLKRRSRLISERTRKKKNSYQPELEKRTGASRSASIRATTEFHPISFSWPGSWTYPDEVSRTNFLSNVVPGSKYSFWDYESYLEQYKKANLAITFKKGGWDCFRHLEILASGCLPLMPDVSMLPERTMVHYPKSLIRTTLSSVKSRSTPPELHRDWWRQNVVEKLSSRSMANYLSEVASIRGNRILFYDPYLPTRADYLSVLTLIGLKQLFGSSVEVAFPVPYIYKDYLGDTGRLYGRGFGYTRILGSDVMTDHERQILIEKKPLVTELSNMKEAWDGVVFGDVSAIRDVVETISVRSEKKIYLWGSDSPPTGEESDWLLSLDGVVFSRELYD